MNRNKIVAVFLSIAVFSTSSIGCSMFDRDDEAVIDTVNKYATAVIEADVEGIVACLEDGDDYEDEIDDLISDSNTSDRIQEIRNAILNTMEYFIDVAAVESSKKDAEACVDITYRVVDYQSVCSDVISEGGSIDDYINALGDADARTLNIDQTIDLVYEDNQWYVSDDDCDQLFEVYSFFESNDFLWFTEEHVIDNINVIEDVDSLNAVLGNFYSVSGVIPSIYTMYVEDYQNEWFTLEDYAYSKYIELFGDDEDHYLIVYAIPANQRESFLNGDLEVPDYEFETMIGNDADRVIDYEVSSLMVNTIWEQMEDGKNPGEVFETAFTCLINRLS